MKKIYFASRVAIFFLLLLNVVGAVLFLYNVINGTIFAAISAIFAIIVGVLGIFAVKPLDFESELYKITKYLDTDLSTRLSQKKVLDDYINNRSIELLLVKLKAITEEAIIIRYKNSEIAKLVEELESIEKQLDDLNVKYDELDLPDRFKKIVLNLKRQDELDQYIEIFGAIPYSGRFIAPFLRAMASRGLLPLLRYNDRNESKNVTQVNVNYGTEAESEKSLNEHNEIIDDR